MSLPILAVPSRPAIAGLFEPGLSCFADGLPSSFVFVVGCEVADAGVESNGIPMFAGDGEFGAQGGRVLDGEQVRVFGLEVPVEALDPRLISRLSG